MKIAIIGAGNMGLALAAALQAQGHDIALGFTRSPERLAADAERLGAAHGEPADIVAGADVVVFAVPAAQVPTAVAACGPLGGPVIISVSSGLDLDPSGGRIGIATTRTQSVAEDIAAATGSGRVVQSFTLTFADMLARRGDGQRPTLPIAGDDAAAVAVVAGLVEQAGFEPLPVGALRNARALETLATATAQLAVVGGLAPLIAVTLVRGH